MSNDEEPAMEEIEDILEMLEIEDILEILEIVGERGVGGK
jgi:hypothetical protein